MLPRVGVGANYARWGQLEYLRVLAVLREYILRVLAVFRGSVLRILPVLPSISVLDTAGAACTRFCTAHTPSTHSQYLGRQYCNTLSTQKYKMYSILPSISMKYISGSIGGSWCVFFFVLLVLPAASPGGTTSLRIHPCPRLGVFFVSFSLVLPCYSYYFFEVRTYVPVPVRSYLCSFFFFACSSFLFLVFSFLVFSFFVLFFSFLFFVVFLFSIFWGCWRAYLACCIYPVRTMARHVRCTRVRGNFVSLVSYQFCANSQENYREHWPKLAKISHFGLRDGISHEMSFHRQFPSKNPAPGNVREKALRHPRFGQNRIPYLIFTSRR